MKHEHFYFDGYSLDTKLLSEVDIISNLSQEIYKTYFDKHSVVIVIPYFNGVIKTDGGVSIVILGDNKHFTCHTFCYKNTIFVDYFGNKADFENIKKIILKYYPTNDYDLCINNDSKEGKFGKHLIFENVSPISFDEGINLIKSILVNINMTPINNYVYVKKDENNFDILQPIAESHISIHQKDNRCVIDVFSCKYFDEKLLCNTLNSNDFKQVNRGIKYK